jgi:hypothetical protein
MYETLFKVEKHRPTCSAERADMISVHSPNYTSSVWFTTYGDHVFAKAKHRIAMQAAESGVFNVIRTFDREAFVNWADGVGISKNYTSAKRGGGFWLWKPWVIWNVLEEMSEGDILVYADAGCHILRSGSQRFYEYFDMVSNDPFSVLAFSLQPDLEVHWTTEAILSYFNASNSVRYSPHLMATAVVMRKCKSTRQLIDAWLQVAIQRPDLFSDDHNIASKNAFSSQTGHCFRDNRHDQSVFSVLRKSLPHKKCVIQLRDETYGAIGYYTPIIAKRDKL